MTNTIVKYLSKLSFVSSYYVTKLANDAVLPAPPIVQAIKSTINSLKSDSLFEHLEGVMDDIRVQQNLVDAGGNYFDNYIFILKFDSDHPEAVNNEQIYFARKNKIQSLLVPMLKRMTGGANDVHINFTEWLLDY